MQFHLNIFQLEERVVIKKGTKSAFDIALGATSKNFGDYIIKVNIIYYLDGNIITVSNRIHTKTSQELP